MLATDSKVCSRETVYSGGSQVRRQENRRFPEGKGFAVFME